tara:strand:- start:3855 stop:4130 length:276 start_codon:yes stop_codon:yes gene_type:complete
LGKRFNNDHFSVITLKNNDGNSFYYAVIVSKKNIPLAVNRNKIKRRMRQAVIELYSKFDVSHSSNLFIYNSKETLEFNEIQKKISLLFKKL